MVFALLCAQCAGIYFLVTGFLGWMFGLKTVVAPAPAGRRNSGSLGEVAAAGARQYDWRAAADWNAGGTDDAIWRTRVLMEYIFSANEIVQPSEYVIMFYDLERRAFCYYSNSQNIKHTDLNRLAAKYVNVFCCKSFWEETDGEGDGGTAPASSNSLCGLSNTSDSAEGAVAGRGASHVPPMYQKRMNIPVGRGAGAVGALRRRGTVAPVVRRMNHFIRLGRIADYNFLGRSRSVGGGARPISWREFRRSSVTPPPSNNHDELFDCSTAAEVEGDAAAAAAATAEE